MDIVFQILFEVFFEGYLALMKLMIPKTKMTEKKQRVMEWIAAAIGVFIIFAFVIGIAMLSENKNSVVGYILLIGSIVIFFVQLIFGIVSQVLK